METDALRCKGNHLHWFRKDLRLHDNPALLKCLEDCENFYGVYILDTEAWLRLNPNASPTIWRFFLETLHDLNDKLRKLNSRLFVVQGSPVRVLPKLFHEWNISRLTFNTDHDLQSNEREEVVFSLACIANVEVAVHSSHTLHDVNRYIESNNGNVPLGLKEFQQVFHSLDELPCPVECVNERHFSTCRTPNSEWLDANFHVPRLEELGFVDQSFASKSSFRGGETEALQHYNNYVEMVVSSNVSSKKSSGLSPYFRYGCLSVRYVYHSLHSYVHENVTIARFLKGLETRDFFFMLASRISNWDKIERNPICLGIPWEENKEYLKKFRKGKTGFPWIDATIAQLKQEGWISYESRQSLAFFLTRGCLWISWEEGVKLFEDYCLDAERSLNVGSWLCASASSFFNHDFNAYCPVEEAKRLDEHGIYIRKYLPVLQDLPDEYIYQPWLAPQEVQERANCIIGKDYPKRMIDHTKARLDCLEKLREFHKELIHPISSTGQNVVHWFRKDLRLHDNPALVEAWRNGGNFYGVYIFDPLVFQDGKSSVNHGKFLLQCLRDLDAKLRECGSYLYVIRDSPMAAFKNLFVKWRVTKLTMEADTEPYGKKLEDSVVALAKSVTFKSLLKYHIRSILYLK